MVGQPTKCTPDLTKRIAAEIQEGVLPEVACECEGIGTTTYYRWMQEGADADAPASRREFRDAITRAKGLAQAKALKAVREGVQVSGMPDWKAAHQWLKVCDPDRYVEEIKVTVRQDAIREILQRLREGTSPEVFSAVLGCLDPGGSPDPQDNDHPADSVH